MWVLFHESSDLPNKSNQHQGGLGFFRAFSREMSTALIKYRFTGIVKSNLFAAKSMKGQLQNQVVLLLKLTLKIV